MIKFKHRGNFSKTEKFLIGASRLNLRSVAEKYAEKGVIALSEATPVLTGITAHSWGYEIKERKGQIGITWFNTNVENGTPVVILIQYGHGTKNGGYVPGRDFINPAIKPIADEFSEAIRKEVSRL